MKAGMYAPSGMNRQSPMIVAITNPELRNKLSRINLDIIIGKQLKTSSGHSDPFYGAPVVLVVLAKKDCPTRVYDGSVVIENMLIAAHSLGLGACWIHRAKEMFETEEGKALCMKYREVREACLINIHAESGIPGASIGETAQLLRAISSLYDTAARAAASL